jgi:hypothetical protein
MGHDIQDLNVNIYIYIERKKIRLFNLHRPQRSSVIRSRHDLQNVCWQGNCNGSRKISRQIGLKMRFDFEIIFY